MHPCCWGNLFRELLQFLPFLAAAAFAVKQVAGQIFGLKGQARGSKKADSGAGSGGVSIPVTIAVSGPDDKNSSCCSSRRES